MKQKKHRETVRLENGKAIVESEDLIGPNTRFKNTIEVVNLQSEIKKNKKGMRRI